VMRRSLIHRLERMEARAELVLNPIEITVVLVDENRCAVGELIFEDGKWNHYPGANQHDDRA